MALLLSAVVLGLAPLPDNALIHKDETPYYKMKVNPCGFGYVLTPGDEPQWGDIPEAGDSHTHESLEGCREACNGQDKCNSFEFSPKRHGESRRSCNLHKSPIPTEDVFEDFLFCGKDPCGEGYSLTPGDIPGWGDIPGAGDSHTHESQDNCRAACNANPLCNSFEFSPTRFNESRKSCNLHGGRLPTQDVHEDFLFCSKDPCGNGYALKPGDSPGWGDIPEAGDSHTHESIGGCREACNGQSKCKSFEFSPKRHDESRFSCNLHKSPIPTQDVFEDFLFCSMIEPCGKGYTLTPGDIPGWGDIPEAGDSHIHKSRNGCRAACNAQPSCNSFEWSPARFDSNLHSCNLHKSPIPTQDVHEDFLFCAKDTSTVARMAPPSVSA